MKAIVCEMCNSNDVIKQDGLYVCQNCGTKYTTEDAKKLMVDISGSSVKVDESEKAENYRKLAREAREMNNVQKACEYYNRLVTLCPNDWEAVFFSVYYTSASCVIAQIAVAAANVTNAITLVAPRIADLPSEEKIDSCNEMVTYALLLKETFIESARKHQANYGTQHSYTEFCERTNAAYQMAKAAADAALLCGLKSRAVNIYESLRPAYDVWDLARLLESLEPGRGVKMVAPVLEIKKAKHKATRNVAIFSFVMFLIGVVGVIFRRLYLLALGLVAVFGLLSIFLINKNKRLSKEIAKMEYDFEHLKD